MQKECHECQQRRLAIKRAISSSTATPETILTLKKEYLAHLQWMLRQRAVLESIIQKSNHENYLVENADKCGDTCLYLPSSNRVSSDNVNRYRYRVSLQANVYAGKLFHLSILLPNLKTGENFGITSFLCGLVSMIQMKEVTSRTRYFMRGVDGGSENVNHASLGLNAFLVNQRRFDVVQQHRLPPSHSHIHLTDGTFSVIEEWLTGNGFPGCNTLGELITYLRNKFSKAHNYANKKVELNLLIANFAFNKWFSGHLHMNKVCVCDMLETTKPRTWLTYMLELALHTDSLVCRYGVSAIRLCGGTGGARRKRR